MGGSLVDSPQVVRVEIERMLLNIDKHHIHDDVDALKIRDAWRMLDSYVLKLEKELHAAKCQIYIDYPTVSVHSDQFITMMRNMVATSVGYLQTFHLPHAPVSIKYMYNILELHLELMIVSEQVRHLLTQNYAIPIPSLKSIRNNCIIYKLENEVEE
jgi:hypothetical protein